MTDKLPSIYEHARQFGIIAKKSLGQNFLFDENLTDKIVRLSGNIIDQHVVEIGPGVGGLTRSILKAGPRKLTVIEKDERCIDLLYDIKKFYPQLDIISEDALNVNMSRINLSQDTRVKIIANLPYNIATTLLFNWLEQVDQLSDLTLMFQKEVAERICALENTKSYGKLSVMVQLKMAVKKMMDLSPQAFTPPPKVSSAIVHFKPLIIQPPIEIIETIKLLTHHGFNQRRKMIHKSLSPVIKDFNIYGKANIGSHLRAENLTVADYCTLAQIVNQTIIYS